MTFRACQIHEGHKLPLDGFSMAPLWPRVPGPGGTLSDVMEDESTLPSACGRLTSGADSVGTWEMEV